MAGCMQTPPYCPLFAEHADHLLDRMHLSSMLPASSCSIGAQLPLHHLSLNKSPCMTACQVQGCAKLGVTCVQSLHCLILAARLCQVESVDTISVAPRAVRQGLCDHSSIQPCFMPNEGFMSGLSHIQGASSFLPIPLPKYLQRVLCACHA